MHEGQLRKSGEPYLIHPVEVAKILAGLGMDEQTIIAGFTSRCGGGYRNTPKNS